MTRCYRAAIFLALLSSAPHARAQDDEPVAGVVVEGQGFEHYYPVPVWIVRRRSGSINAFLERRRRLPPYSRGRAYPLQVGVSYYLFPLCYRWNRLRWDNPAPYYVPRRRSTVTITCPR